MQTTEIIEGACTGERVGIRVISVEQPGPKRRLLLDHRVRNVVAIDPLDSGPHGNGEFLGREREIVDRDHVGGILRRYRTKRQQRSDDRPQKQCNDQGAVKSKPGRGKAKLADWNLHALSSINRPTSYR